MNAQLTTEGASMDAETVKGASSARVPLVINLPQTSAIALVSAEIVG